MNNIMFNTIRQFIEFKRTIKNYQMIDDLDQADKVKLDAFDRDVLNKIYNKSLERLSSEMLQQELSSEYVKGAKSALFFFKEQFRKYKIKDFK